MWLRQHVPRILGFAPFIVMAISFFLAAISIKDNSLPRTKLVLFVYCAFCLVLSLLFYWFCLDRRRRLGRLNGVFAGQNPGFIQTENAYVDKRYADFSDLKLKSPVTAKLVVGMLLASLFCMILFTLFPVHVAPLFGSSAIFMIAAAEWVSFGSLIVYWAEIYEMPFIGLLLVWAGFWSFFNNNHAVRLEELSQNQIQTIPDLMKSDSQKHDSIRRAFIQWHDSVNKLYPELNPVTSRPVIIVATEGGGIRAAYWTASVLGRLEDESIRQGPNRPPFASHVFAISGVSGGSVGAAVFDALVAEPAAPDRQNFVSAGEGILADDFLSPTLASMLFSDLAQRFFPFPLPLTDRATVLEKSWEHSCYNWTGKKRMEDPMRCLWAGDPTDPQHPQKLIPNLFLNGTMVGTGQRVITSNLLIESELSDPQGAQTIIPELGDVKDVRDTFGDVDKDVRLSTAALLSARFTYVTPAGLLPDREHVVDGGYFDNSGADSAGEILNVVTSVINNEGKNWTDHPKPIVIIISSSPPDAQDSQPSQSEFLSEVLDPLMAILHARQVRAAEAQEALEEKSFISLQPPSPNSSPDIEVEPFDLKAKNIHIPLGWVLSGAAAKAMRLQIAPDLKEDAGNLGESYADDFERNESTCKTILSQLPQLSEMKK